MWSLVSVLLLPHGTFAQTTVPATTYSSGQNATVSGPTTITTGTNAVTVASGASITYKVSGSGHSITLGPGFTASSGSKFRAFVYADADLDGMDDAWEATHNLSSPTADADSDGLINLIEYILGTHPGSAKTTDASNATTLNVHRPN